MSRNYSITFKSLRTGTVYTVNIGGGSGETVPLKGAAEPFVTTEDGDEDMFAPLRTQSGYIRIVDDGKDANGNVLGDGWWKDLLPKNNTERPVSLITTIGASYTVHWQGFIQSQNFSGVLYGNPQEREFPVQCILSSLVGASIPSNIGQMRNFAWVIATLVGVVESASGNAVFINNYHFQGGADAKTWLLTKVDWQLFMHVVEGALVPKYDAQEVLTDICKFWGWTMRTQGLSAYFTCMDDSAENSTWITFTREEMLALTASTSGETSTTSTVTLGGDIFANTNNEELLTRGVKRAVVKVDVDAEDTTMEFAPVDMEAAMGEPSIWVDGGLPMVGYFRTATKYNLTSESRLLSAYTESNIGGFERRILFSTAEAEDGQAMDSILIRRDYVEVSGHGSTIIQLATKQVMAYGGGSLTIKGNIYEGAQAINTTDEGAGIYMRIGIGMSHATASWFWASITGSDLSHLTIENGWSQSSNYETLISVFGNTLGGVKIIHDVSVGELRLEYPKIPIANDLYGYLYVDILGGREIDAPYEIGDFEVEFTKETTIWPTSFDDVRARTIKKKLATTKEYAAENASTVEDKWNADCIFATDNGLEYGHGIIMKPDGGFVETVQYGGSSTNQQHPEQHLVNRVANFGNKARRMLTMTLRKGVGTVNDVTPRTKVSLGDADRWYALSISHNWRDDEKIITMVEL